VFRRLVSRVLPRMTRRLLVALAAVLTLGSVLDAFVQDGHGVEETLGREDPDWLRDADGSPVGLTLLGTAERGREETGRFSLYVALRELAPGASIHVASDLERDALPVVHLVGIAGARSVATVDPAGLVPPEREPTRSGLYRGGDRWQLHVVGDPTASPDHIVVWREDGILQGVDARLLTGSLSAGIESTRSRALDPSLMRTTVRGRDDPPSLIRGTAGETAILVTLLILGGLLTPRSQRFGMQRMALAGAVGVALHAGLGILVLPGWSGLLATIGVALLVAGAGRTAGVDFGWRRADLRALAVATAVIGSVTGVVRASRYVLLTGDSHHYWGGGAALADGTFGLVVLDVKRGIAQTTLHALGFLVGVEGLQALGPLLLIIGLFLILGAVRDRSDRIGVSVAVLTLAALIMSPQVRAMAAFLGGHLLVAVLLLALVLLLGAVDESDRPEWLMPAVLSVIAALVVTRPEGGVLVALVLVGASRVSVTTVPWVGLGLASTAWAGMLWVGALRYEGARPPAVDLLLLIGVLALLVAPIQRRLNDAIWRSVVSTLGVALWGVTLALLARDRVVFLEVTVTNIGRGFGGWGVLGPLLMIVALVVLALTAGRDDGSIQAARWLLIGFVPVALLSKLGDGLQVTTSGFDRLLSGGGRTGWGDSVNRMWTHVVLIVAYLLVRAAERAPSTVRPSARRAGPMRTVFAGAVSAVVLVAFGPWVAGQWRPDHVPIRSVSEERQLLAFSRSGPVADLTDGTVVEQLILLPESTPGVASGSGFFAGSDATILAACIDVTFVTYGSDVTGRYRIELTYGERTATRTIDARDVVDWGTQRACLDLEPEDTGSGSPSEMHVRISGNGAAPGRAAAVLGSDEAVGFGAVVTTVAPDGTKVVRRVMPLGITLSIAVDDPIPVFSRPLERSNLLLPWLAALLGIAAVVERISHPARLLLRGGVRDDVR